MVLTRRHAMNLLTRLVLISTCFIFSSCEYRLSALGCLRIEPASAIDLSKLVSDISRRRPQLVFESFDGSQTKRQRDVGEAWLMAKHDDVEISARNHEGKFADICVYDHSGGEGVEAALLVLEEVKGILSTSKVPYTIL